MGQERACTARLGDRTSQGRALLETGYVLFRGDFRVRVPFAAMRSVRARGGWLEIVSSDGALALELGAAAEKWAQKILHPPSRLDKLGIKAEMRVALIRIGDAALESEIAALGAKAGRTGDVILFGAEKKASLDQLEKLAVRLKAGGALWVIYPKGVREITEMDVLRAIRAAGLVDVKVASFSPTHTALKAVIPKSRRAGI